MSNLNKIAIAIPIHPPHFMYGVNLVYSSMGAEYDLVFVHSTYDDRKAFEKLFPEPALQSFQSLVLTDNFSEKEMQTIDSKRVHPTVKKFYALDCLKTKYSFIICMDAEIIILKKTGWNEAAQRIFERKCWFGGPIKAMDSFQKIIECSMTELPHSQFFPENYFKCLDNLSYTWWWDLPVYRSADIEDFFKFINWHEKDYILKNITWFSFDHIVYQHYTSVKQQFKIVKVTGKGDWISLENCPSHIVEHVNTNEGKLHWVNSVAYSENYSYYSSHGFLAVYHIDRVVDV